MKLKDLIGHKILDISDAVELLIKTDKGMKMEPVFEKRCVCGHLCKATEDADCPECGRELNGY